MLFWNDRSVRNIELSDDKMEASRKKILTGIEPVDELMGGIDQGELFLVHGEASGKSLFGIKFLIEGLKQGENCALVIRYSPEDAVRRFARLGYDCLDDVYSGRLVILEYSDDIIQKMGKLRELTPVLRELEWLLGETKPERLVFDPVTGVLTGADGDFEKHAAEFAEWARSFGATVALIGHESSPEILESLKPLVAESFRFDFRESGSRASRFIAFEKSSNIPDQAIEVDPSRGMFLLGGSYATEIPELPHDEPHPPSVGELESIRQELRSVREQISKEEPLPEPTPSALEESRPLVMSEQRDNLQTQRLTRVEEFEAQAPRGPIESIRLQPIADKEIDLGVEELLAPTRAAQPESREPFDELSALLDDLSGDASPLELDLPEVKKDSAEGDAGNA